MSGRIATCQKSLAPIVLLLGVSWIEGSDARADQPAGLEPQLPRSRANLSTAFYHPGKSRVMVGTRAGQLTVFEAQSAKILVSTTIKDWNQGSVRDPQVVIGSDGTTVYCWGESDRIRLTRFNIDTGATAFGSRRFSIAPTPRIKTARPSPDMKKLLVSGLDWLGSIDLTALGSEREPLTEFKSDGQETGLPSVAAAAWFPDSKQVISCGMKAGTAIIWDVSTGRPSRILKGHDSWVVAVDVSSDGARVATCSLDKSVIVWDAMTGEQLLILQDERREPSSVKFSPDGRRLAVGYANRSKVTPVIWDAKTGKKLVGGVYDPVAGEEFEVLDFTQDGRTLVTAPRAEFKSGGLISFIDTGTGNVMARWICFNDSRDWLLVGADGRFDGSEDGRNMLRFKTGGSLLPVTNERVKQLYTPGLLSALLKLQLK